MKTAEVIRDLQQYQTVPYPFVRVNELQMWLDNELGNSSEIQELYDLSTQVEPREREDEKMYLYPVHSFSLVPRSLALFHCPQSREYVLTLVLGCCRRVGFYERLGYPPILFGCILVPLFALYRGIYFVLFWVFNKRDIMFLILPLCPIFAISMPTLLIIYHYCISG